MAKDIAQWLDSLGLGQYAQAFADNGIDIEALPHLRDDDFERLGVLLGHMRRLQSAIENLSADEPPSQEPELRPAEAERRQLTVMFCDLVGSTALSGRLDPEDLREALRRYQDAVSGIVTRHDGYVANYLGDGVLAFFGWPRAHEDQAAQAVRAALEAIRAVAALSVPGTAGETLAARAGIATGQVVVGDLRGETARQSNAVAGETPNVAARLQAAAQPGQVVIGPTTQHLLGAAFELDDLGALSLKGVSEPLRAWRVIEEAVVEDRFDAHHTGDLTDFVGRNTEVDLLLDRWHQANAGDGQTVLLSGQAGVGKSRIVRAVREQLADNDHVVLQYQCSPFYGNSPLYPVIRQLERAAKFKADDLAEVRLDKLEALLLESERPKDQIDALFAALLSLPAGDRYPPLGMNPKQQLEATLAALSEQMTALAVRSPLLLVVEDAHWIDPTTLDALAQMIDAVVTLPILIVVTGRLEFEPPWSGRAHVTTLALNRLGRTQSAEMVDRLTGGKTLPEELLEQILDKTDGVPLFVEEFTKTVLESSLLEDAGGRYTLNGPLPALAIPSTLHDSLMARLDRLSQVKNIAQIGAAIGREFPYDLIAAVAPLEDTALRAGLKQLVKAELVFQRGTPPASRYQFKHALVQDAAYASLLKSHRRDLHARIAAALEAGGDPITGMPPELIAHHLTAADEFERAVPYWRRAANQSAAASAHAEAEQNAKIALELLQKVVPSTKRDTQELKLRLTLGSVLMTTRGFAAPEVGEVYARAHEICQDVGDTSEKFAATWGYWLFSYQSGAHVQAEQLAAKVLTITEGDLDIGRRLQAHHAAWTHLSMTGNLKQCQKHIQEGKSLYDVNIHFDHAHHFAGHDPGVCCWNHAGMIDWILGYPDDARQDMETSRALADELSHPFSQMLSRVFSCWVHEHRRDLAETAAMASDAIALCNEHGFHQYSGVMAMFKAWARADATSVQACFAELQDGLEAFRARGSSARLSYFLSVFADGCRKLGKIDEGLAAVEEGFECAKEHGQTSWEPELHRMRGSLASMQPRPDLAAIEKAYRTALDIARERAVKSFELRAATDLAEFLQGQGKRDAARDLLEPIHGWFTQGFDTPDLVQAMAVLDKMR